MWVAEVGRGGGSRRWVAEVGRGGGSQRARRSGYLFGLRTYATTRINQVAADVNLVWAAVADTATLKR